MRGKAIAVFLAFLIYVATLFGYVLYEDSGLRDQFLLMQNLHEVDQSLGTLRMSSYHALLEVHDAKKLGEKIGQSDKYFQSARHPVSLIESNFNSLADRLAPETPNFSRIATSIAQVKNAFSGHDLPTLFARLKDLISESETLSLEQRRRLEQVTTDFQQRSERLVSSLTLYTIIGLGLFGTVSWLFFLQLIKDFERLRRRAIEVAKGEPGEPLELTRHDEVGDLMAAVNQMAVDLDQRERELVLEREKTFQQEKMAAIGTLAAGIAHEIGNPITAISGIAQEMCEARSDFRCMSTGFNCRPELILEQAERIAKITREVTEFSAPRSTQRQWLDLNELICSTVSLLRYDRRFSDFEVTLDLDGQLPAIMGVGDQLTQVLMNLIINAADAVGENKDRAPSITVSSQPDGENVILRVCDNGPGMDPLTRVRATEAFYTTKAPGKGTGLGLTVCAAIIAGHGGSMTLASKQGEGATVTIKLPIQGNKDNSA